MNGKNTSMVHGGYPSYHGPWGWSLCMTTAPNWDVPSTSRSVLWMKELCDAKVGDKWKRWRKHPFSINFSSPFYLSIFLIYLSFLSIYPSFHLSVFLSVSISLSLFFFSLSLSLSLNVYIYIHMHIMMCDFMMYDVWKMLYSGKYQLRGESP